MFDWYKNFGHCKNSTYEDAHSEPKKSVDTCYRLGLTNDNRVSFQMGYSEIIMNRAGCQQVIDQIAFFMNQLPENEE